METSSYVRHNLLILLVALSNVVGHLQLNQSSGACKRMQANGNRKDRRSGGTTRVRLHASRHMLTT